MWDSEIQAEELRFARELQGVTQFVRPYMKSHILHVDVGVLEGRVLHLRRKRVCDRIAENAQPDWRIHIVCDLTPVLQILERVD